MALSLPSLAELRDTQADIYRFRERVVVIQLVVFVCFMLLLMRLAYLQIVRHEDLMEQAAVSYTHLTLPTNREV